MPIVLKSGSVNLLEHSGPVKACNGIAFTFSMWLVVQFNKWVFCWTFPVYLITVANSYQIIPIAYTCPLLNILVIWLHNSVHTERINIGMIYYIIHTQFRSPCYKIKMYRVIHKSLRDFLPLRYSSWDDHAEKSMSTERERETPSFCPILQMLDTSTVGDI
jgi:hypothetical protein